MFIVGLSNQAIKEKLLQEESLNLDKAIKIAKAIEITQLQARNLNKNTEVVVAKVGRSAHNSANWQKSKNSHLSNQVEGTSNSRQKTPLVFLVFDRTQKVDKNVLRLARERNDDYGRAITGRLAAVHDLLAADAQYHVLCMKDLNRPRRKGNPPTGCVTVMVTALIKKSSLMRTTLLTAFWRHHFHLIILKKLKWIRQQIRANPVTIAQNCPQSIPRDHPVYNDGRRNDG
ncbi:hypothetical protein JTB14_005660 [Gonioctena quinquepunctata]|nr:hypothetical protein JTB14_005660 [Gonioctena quinquepunctata]